MDELGLGCARRMAEQRREERVDQPAGNDIRDESRADDRRRKRRTVFTVEIQLEPQARDWRERSTRLGPRPEERADGRGKRRVGHLESFEGPRQLNGEIDTSRHRAEPSFENRLTRARQMRSQFTKTPDHLSVEQRRPKMRSGDLEPGVRDSIARLQGPPPLPLDVVDDVGGVGAQSPPAT